MKIDTKDSDKGYLYDQVTQYINQLIDAGSLKPGDKAPSLRKLSQQLKVSISTVSQAYVTLETQGILKAKPQSGFYVNSQMPVSIKTPKQVSCECFPKKVKIGKIFDDVFRMANNPNVIPFGAAKGSMELMPTKSLLRATQRVAARFPLNALDYCFPPGNKRLRQQIASRYQNVGLSVSPDEVIITSGATEAMFLSLQSIASRGDIIVVESPTYFSVLRLIERLGMMALEIDTDPDTGMDLEALADALETMEIKAMLSVPNFSNPVGSMMPDEKKKELVELLESFDVPLIEDDVFGNLYFGEERPRIAKCYEKKGMVLSCSSYSKTLAPGYRIGWVLPGKYYEQALDWKYSAFSATASLMQMSVAEFLASGDYDRHLVRLRKAFRQQVERGRFMIAQAFPEGTRISNPKGGFVLWIELPKGVSGLTVYQLAVEKGIGITPGFLFSATRKYKNFIRINCGNPWTEQLEAAIETLADIVKSLM